MTRFLAKSILQQQEEEPQINLTPLIDVVFVILIMFIVVAPLLELDRVELADASGDPACKTEMAQSDCPISIHVHQNNQVWFNNQPVTLEQLPDLLKKSKERYPQIRPQLFHDKKAHFGTYQVVKNAAEAAGFQQMDIILKPA